MHFPHLADHASLVPLADVAHALQGMPLVSHDGLHLVLVVGLLQGARLPDIVGERLLCVHRDAALHRGERGRKVCVIRRADDDEIQFLPVDIDEFAEIFVAFRFRKPLEPIRASHVVNIGDGYDVVLVDIVKAGSRNTAATDEPDIQFVVCPFRVCAEKLERLGSGEGRGCGGLFEEATSGVVAGHLLSLEVVVGAVLISLIRIFRHATSKGLSHP